MSQEHESLRVLSLNCWGLFIIAKDREFRLKAIADALSTMNCDIVTLQEVWMQKDFEYIVDKTRHSLPYSKYFYSGPLGSGLAILSKYPIISTAYHRYALNGKPLKFQHGDYYVGKGCGTVLINHPLLGLTEIFNTHLHAGYGMKHQYTAHRATQCWQLCNLLRASAAMGRQIILSGDFNSVPTSFTYRLIREQGFMTDSWLQVHGEPEEGKFDKDNLTAVSFTQYFGFTSNSPFNSFSRNYVPNDLDGARKILGKRLDYIFYRYTPEIACVESKVVYADLIPGSDMSYSDHFGVLSVFKATSNSRLIENEQMAPVSEKLCHPGLTQLQQSSVQEILNCLKLEAQKAQKDSDWLLTATGLCLLVQIILYVLVVVLPTTIPEHLLIILVTVFGGAVMNLASLAIPVSLIVGFVFGHRERRTLQQFIQEVESFQSCMFTH